MGWSICTTNGMVYTYSNSLDLLIVTVQAQKRWAMKMWKICTCAVCAGDKTIKPRYTAPQHLVCRVVPSLHINHMQMRIIEVFICRRVHMNTSMILICIWLICRLGTALHTKCCGAVVGVHFKLWHWWYCYFPKELQFSKKHRSDFVLVYKELWWQYSLHAMIMNVR